jgi:hypothetical protein
MLSSLTYCQPVSAMTQHLQLQHHHQQQQQQQQLSISRSQSLLGKRRVDATGFAPAAPTTVSAMSSSNGGLEDLPGSNVMAAWMVHQDADVDRLLLKHDELLDDDHNAPLHVAVGYEDESFSFFADHSATASVLDDEAHLMWPYIANMHAPPTLNNNNNHSTNNNGSNTTAAAAGAAVMSTISQQPQPYSVPTVHPQQPPPPPPPEWQQL